jgi:hypothetical protein
MSRGLVLYGIGMIGFVLGFVLCACLAVRPAIDFDFTVETGEGGPR